MRRSTQQVVWLKDLRESISSRPSPVVNQELFSDFGTDIDLTNSQRFKHQEQRSAELKQRFNQRVLEDLEEETKPFPKNPTGLDGQAHMRKRMNGEHDDQ